MRDLSRLALFRPEHQEALLASYWGRAPAPRSLGRLLYATCHRAFLLRNGAKERLRGKSSRNRGLLARGSHAHLPAAPADARVRDRIVWDRLSDQPHQHAGRLAKLRVRLADAGSHASQG
ncbi:MAG: hypothetical protein M3O15_01515, partial [Acidobacteriota bacterium]|nr:hypothetical protein [Acidobacteriota bacterium]